MKMIYNNIYLYMYNTYNIICNIYIYIYTETKVVSTQSFK